jgi:hypothetical protein
MAWEDKELSGVVFRNKFKKSDAQPAWKGTLLVNGQPHELAMWEKDGKNGPYFSFKIGPARERDDGGGRRVNQSSDDTDGLGGGDSFGDWND